jgi:hypothetical protein
MACSLPSQMFTNMLNIAKGWPHSAALDFSAKMSAAVTFNAPAGRCVHLNSAGEFEMGIGAAATDMPMFIFQGTCEFDTANTRNDQWTPISPSGRIAAFPCKGSYEFETTEFDTTLTYVPGDRLTATASNTNAATGGLVTNASMGTIYASGMLSVVGVVLKGVYTNAYGVKVLNFYPVYLPGKA